MDKAVARVGDDGRYRVRAAPGPYTLPVEPLQEADTERRTWHGRELGVALAATAVDFDELRDDAAERVTLARMQGYVAQFGPQAALRLLAALYSQSRLN